MRVPTEIRGFPLPSLCLSSSLLVREFLRKISGIFTEKKSEKFLNVIFSGKITILVMLHFVSCFS